MLVCVYISQSHKTVICLFNFFIICKHVYVWLRVPFVFHLNLVSDVNQRNFHFLHHKICLKARITLEEHFPLLLRRVPKVHLFFSRFGAIFVATFITVLWSRFNSRDLKASRRWSSWNSEGLDIVEFGRWRNFRTTLWRWRYVTSLFGLRCSWFGLRCCFLCFAKAPINIIGCTSFTFLDISTTS